MSGFAIANYDLADVMKAAVKGKGQLLRELVLGLRQGEELRITRNGEDGLLTVSYRDETYVASRNVSQLQTTHAVVDVVALAVRDCRRSVRD